ncbi:MAG: restriction endonuclease subunit S [Chlorobiaceae bacterium]
MKRLDEVCQIKPPKAEARKRISTDALVSFVPMEDLGIDKKFFNVVQKKPLSVVSGSYTYFADGDVLLAKITPCFENGKLGIAGALTNGIGFGSSEYIVFRSDGRLRNEWLYYYLSRESFRVEGAKLMSGAVGHKRVPKEFIENYLIPVPPLPEQQRIVALLDEAFAAIAIAKANAEKNLKNARALFDSYLNSVFSQRGDGWVENKLVSLTSKIGSGATPRGGGESYKTEGTSLIRSLNVHDPGFRYSKLAFLDDGQADGLSNVIVQPGDVLLNITGASVARCCIVPDDVLPARVNQHVSIIRPISSKLDSDFLHYLLISKYYKDQLLQTGAEGGATRQAITKAQIQDFSVGYPADKGEQQSIVSKLDALRKETQHLESIYQKKIEALDVLKKSILHQAFNGEL